MTQGLNSSAIRGLVVAGTQSGVGKTTVTLGLLAALRRRGLAVQPFKVGPDFIDPGHHTRAAGRLSRNLDGWMLSQAANLALFRRQAQGADLAVVEGVMGLFDGYDGLSEAGSTAQMAKWLGLPVLLVVDAHAMARSAAALVQGFAAFDPGLTLAGVIFNRIGSAAHLAYLKDALAALPGVRCFGGLPRHPELAIPERHLGLATADDHPLEESFLAHLADLLEAHLDLDGLLAALPSLALPQAAPAPAAPATVRLGVARDPAFCFYYPENLDWLVHFGAELVPFSPLNDPKLPENLHGVYLGGGYPELSAARLAANGGLRRALREQAAAGLPIYAECGGLMYLARELTDLEGRCHPMAGVLPLKVRMLPRLKALGYREVTLAVATLLGPTGTTARGHEFHYSEISGETGALAHPYRLTPRRGGEAVAEGYSTGNVLASYVHLHFGSNPEVARNLVERCRAFKEQ
jgi:cobyrinic acid a,c-diamide synthase